MGWVHSSKYGLTDWLTDWLTPWSSVVQKLTVTQSRIPPPQSRNPKFHYCVHNSLPLVPNVGQMYPVHNFPPYLLEIHFNIILSSTPASPSGLTPSDLRSKFFLCISHRSHTCCMIFPSHLASNVKIDGILKTRVLCFWAGQEDVVCPLSVVRPKLYCPLGLDHFSVTDFALGIAGGGDRTLLMTGLLE
jgi:hypothetical protein